MNDKAIDLIYKEVYTKCLAQGCTEIVSKDAAVSCLEKYKKNQFIGTPAKLVKQTITDAKKLIIKKRK